VKAFIFDRNGNAIATDCIVDIGVDTKLGEVRIYCDKSSIGHYFIAAQDTVEGVVAAIRDAELYAIRDAEYWRAEALYAFNHGRISK
jgi:hypothetical protein